MICDIISNVIGDVVFAVLTIGIGYGLYYYFRRAPLFAFFGIAEQRQLVIYVSDLRIILGGAIGADGVRRSFGGAAVAYSEVSAATGVASLFRVALPGQSVQPSWASSLLLSDVSVRIAPAPVPPAVVSFNCTSIAVGSPGYNAASAAVQNDLASPVHFNAQNSEIIVPGLPPVTNPRHSFIARLRHHSHFVFYIGGLSEGGTTAALIFLARHWRLLHRRYRRTPSFYALVEFAGDDPANSHIVAEGQLNVA